MHDLHSASTSLMLLPNSSSNASWSSFPRPSIESKDESVVELCFFAVLVTAQLWELYCVTIPVGWPITTFEYLLTLLLQSLNQVGRRYIQGSKRFFERRKNSLLTIIDDFVSAAGTGGMR